MPDSPDVAQRKVRIVCTLGPSTQTQAAISELIQAGMDIARLNFSHGTQEFHRSVCEFVRKGAVDHKRYVAVMQDLQGPKIRVGKLPKEGVSFKAGDTLLLYPEGTDPKLSTKGRILVPISAEIAETIARDVRKGARILFDDGNIATVASEVAVPEIVVEVETGGKLTSHKGMNLPGTPLSLPAVTEKDLRDLKFGLELGVDAVALSFVRSAEDIEDVQRRIGKVSNHRPLVVAKIEREEAVQVQESIVEAADILLIARGDMAVELGPDRVPVVQKELIRSCNQLGVPVITATQMLESMVKTPTPTRAEANDVANAVFDGTDAVMLSAETASGQYPVRTVQMMSRIIVEAERATDRFSCHVANQPLSGSIVDSVQYSAAKIAQHIGAKAIACITHSGAAARTLSKYRPVTSIIALMDNEISLRKTAFFWGVRGILIPEIVATDDIFEMVESVLKEHGIVADDDMVAITAGLPTLRRGTTNMVKVHRIGAVIERTRRF